MISLPYGLWTNSLLSAMAAIHKFIHVLFWRLVKLLSDVIISERSLLNEAAIATLCAIFLLKDRILAIIVKPPVLSRDFLFKNSGFYRNYLGSLLKLFPEKEIKFSY